MNELSKENSIYLLQHANNPVYWKAWSGTIFQKAQQENKLIIISSGYSSCHWCHVMEHECFENESVAAIMNANFVAVKIDREERPDVDAVYMKALQIMTGKGGWPLNVVCLPNGKPIWGGTYVPQKQWNEVLLQLCKVFENEPETVADYAQKLHDSLTYSSHPLLENKEDFDAESILDKWQKSFDWEFGGYTRAPKFMMPTNLHFMQNYGQLTQNQTQLNWVDLTLEKMALGGIYDTVGGAFSRYSVDHEWHVPHFEKMLYDNAQLLSVYANAYKRTQKPLYKEIVLQTINFIENNWKNTNGGYYAALDADSYNLQGDKVEGAFYTYTLAEIDQLITTDNTLFKAVFGIDAASVWEDNQYILHQQKTIEQLAQQFSLEEEVLNDKIISWKKILFDYRENRQKPTCDTKIITSWNAMYAVGLLDAFAATQQPEYLQKAIDLVQFINAKLTNEEGYLWHIMQNNEVKINAFLEDYAWAIAANISAYQLTFEEHFLYQAKLFCGIVLDDFWDTHQQFFSFTSRQSQQLIAPHFEIEDNVIPSSNAVMAEQLLKLARYYEHDYYQKVAEKMLCNILPHIDYGSAFSHWLWLLLGYVPHQKQLVITGTNAHQMALSIQNRLLPNVLIAVASENTTLPIIAQKAVSITEDNFYICTQNSCLPPISTLEKTLEYL